jgi:hypothetical protein
LFELQPKHLKRNAERRKRMKNRTFFKENFTMNSGYPVFNQQQPATQNWQQQQPQLKSSITDIFAQRVHQVTGISLDPSARAYESVFYALRDILKNTLASTLKSNGFSAEKIREGYWNNVTKYIEDLMGSFNSPKLSYQEICEILASPYFPMFSNNPAEAAKEAMLFNNMTQEITRQKFDNNGKANGNTTTAPLWQNTTAASQIAGLANDRLPSPGNQSVAPTPVQSPNGVNSALQIWKQS